MISQILSEYRHLGASIDAIIQSIPGSSLLRDQVRACQRTQSYTWFPSLKKPFLMKGRSWRSAEHWALPLICIQHRLSHSLLCPKGGSHGSQRSQSNVVSQESCVVVTFSFSQPCFGGWRGWHLCRTRQKVPVQNRRVLHKALSASSSSSAGVKNSLRNV